VLSWIRYDGSSNLLCGMLHVSEMIPLCIFTCFHLLMYFLHLLAHIECVYIKDVLKMVQVFVIVSSCHIMFTMFVPVSDCSGILVFLHNEVIYDRYILYHLSYVFENVVNPHNMLNFLCG
jgi:hypothetical protein